MSSLKCSGYHGSGYLVTRECQSHHLSREIKRVGPVDGPWPVAWAALLPGHRLTTLPLTSFSTRTEQCGGSDDHEVICLVCSRVCHRLQARVEGKAEKRAYSRPGSVSVETAETGMATC